MRVFMFYLQKILKFINENLYFTFAFQNIIFGIGGLVYAMVGTWTLGKQRAFLYMAISVLIFNVVNLVLLEVGEWHILLPEPAKKLIEQGNVKMLLLYGEVFIVFAAIFFFLFFFRLYLSTHSYAIQTVKLNLWNIERM